MKINLFNYYQWGFSGEYAKNPNDPRSAAYVPDSAPDRDLITLTEYDKMGRVVRSRDEIGNWNLTGYDALGRQVKTVASASNPYYDVASDPDLSGYVANAKGDEDIITQTSYDEKGRVKLTQTFYGDDDSDFVSTHFTYDGLGRQVHTVQNLHNYNSADGWHWDATAQEWQDDDDIAIDFSGNNTQNIVNQTTYDADGRVQYTRDVLGRVTYHVYDSQGRRVKTVQNYNDSLDANPQNWVWDETDQRWEVSTVPIPRGTELDQNIITETVYDDQGRVQYTRDSRGNVTRIVYDASGRREKTISNYVADSVAPSGWYWDDEAGAWGHLRTVYPFTFIPLDHGKDNDQNLISQNIYDSEGRVYETRDTAGKVNRTVFDSLGRRVKTIQNYVAQGTTNPLNWTWDAVQNRWEDALTGGNAIDHGADFDQNLISATLYDAVGRVSATRDTRGTMTSFDYDAAGRRRKVTQADGTKLATSHWTCYDKAGRVLRVIQNCTYVANPAVDQTHPDDRNALGQWLYKPFNGQLHDRDLITRMILDKRGRVVKTINPAGDKSHTIYAKDGRVIQTIDPLGVVNHNDYDALRRLVATVANYVDASPSYGDPAMWVLDDTDPDEPIWLDVLEVNPIDHGADLDQNVIARVAFDVAGRRLSLTDPRGFATTYEYDLLNRRTQLTNPLNFDWTTSYLNGTGGIQQVSLTHAEGTMVQQFDRLGRMSKLRYNDTTNTPDVDFEYDLAGNRSAMHETGSSTDIRKTFYDYDQARRLIEVGFDTDGDATPENVVEYTYDVGGLRTQLVIDGTPDLTLVYQYNAKGQLIKMTDWASQSTEYTYDFAGRLALTKRSNGLNTRQGYDSAGRLTALRHFKGGTVFGDFQFMVDGRGNRTQTREALLKPDSGNTSVVAETYVYTPTSAWTYDSGTNNTTTPGAEITFVVMGQTLELNFMSGTDHGIMAIYVNDTFWRSVDTYAATPAVYPVALALKTDGPHTLTIRNTSDKNLASTGYKLRFFYVTAEAIKYDLRTIQYSYDALARVLGADYYPAANVNADPFRQYGYTYDLAGNRLEESILEEGEDPITNTFVYNKANQIVERNTVEFTYDESGRLTDDGTNTYTWDVANRLKTMGGSTYTYNGLGQRIAQQIGSDLTQYLLDVQPGLARVLAATTDTDTTRYVHSLNGIHAQQNPDDSWNFMLNDGLGSVRSIVDATPDLLYVANYDPYGNVADAFGTNASVYGFTGEPTDGNGLVHLRARYYNPGLGVFPSLDPLEMLNRYSYVAGNVTNMVDPSGRIKESVATYNPCNSGNGCLTMDECYFETGWHLATTPKDVLYSVRRMGECLLCYKEFSYFTDLDKLIAVSDYVSGQLPGKDDYVWVMTNLILGVDPSAFAAGAAWWASHKEDTKCNGWGTYANDHPGACKNNAPCDPQDKECMCKTPCPCESHRYLTDTGFHPDFQDHHVRGGGNQIYHLWGAVGAIAGVDAETLYDPERVFTTGFWEVIGGIIVTEIGIQGFHETFESLIGISGGSREDLALTDMGMWLGIRIARGGTSPREVGQWLYDNLGVAGKGALRSSDISGEIYDFLNIGTGDKNILRDIITTTGSQLGDLYNTERDFWTDKFPILK